MNIETEGNFEVSVKLDEVISNGVEIKYWWSSESYIFISYHAEDKESGKFFNENVDLIGELGNEHYRLLREELNHDKEYMEMCK